MMDLISLDWLGNVYELVDGEIGSKCISFNRGVVC